MVPSALSQVYELKTVPPGADVYITENFNREPKKIGVSPIKMNLDELYSQVSSKELYIITIEKEGYENFNYIARKFEGSDIKLEVPLRVSKKYKTIKKHDMLISRMFHIQKLIRSRNFNDALARLGNLEEEFPYFSSIPELKGITYYMSKDVESSLAMFRAAFALNPDNTDAYKMKVYLEKKMGIDAEGDKWS